MRLKLMIFVAEFHFQSSVYFDFRSTGLTCYTPISFMHYGWWVLSFGRIWYVLGSELYPLVISFSEIEIPTSFSSTIFKYRRDLSSHMCPGIHLLSDHSQQIYSFFINSNHRLLESSINLLSLSPFLSIFSLTFFAISQFYHEFSWCYWLHLCNDGHLLAIHHSYPCLWWLLEGGTLILPYSDVQKVGNLILLHKFQSKTKSDL